MSRDALGRVESVSPAVAGGALRGFAIDNPVAGETLSVYETMVRGWVLGRERQVRAVRVLDPTVGQVIREAGLKEHRPDVAAHFPGVAAAAHSGFQIRFSLLNLQTENPVDVVAVLDDGGIVELGRLVYTRQRLETGFQPVLQPLMVSSLGRSGSSWLMHLLGRHPDIVVHGEHPYESRLCKYYVHNLLRTLSEPPETLSPAYDDELFAVNTHWLTAELPLDTDQYRRFRREHLENLARFCQQETDAVYLEVAGGQGKRPRFFAEKHGAGHTARLLGELYPDSREIILVRDFRDMYCSVRDFNRRRGRSDFGMDRAAPGEDLLQVTARRAAGLACSYRSRRRDVFLLRYEELVRDPERRLQETLEHIGIDGGADLVRDLVRGAGADFAHGTSADGLSSIGRWKRDLGADERERSSLAFEQALSAFGYHV
ncbi:MAG: sulfotransferase [Arenicellales bacterium]|jgi:hypothetical protein